jgi:peptidoglycan/LPS O-acetylase OafA/YrhL
MRRVENLEAAVKWHKPHFVVLDGLRGVAAFCVVIFHFSEMVIWDYSKLWIGHGYLAVDFFFCLSGFVMGYAYDDRIATMGLGSFFKARLIRLHPLVVLGSVLGLIAFYANPFGVVAGYGPGKMALVFAASVLMVPFGAIHDDGRSLFGLNAPALSLFWEYVANLLFAVVLYRIRRGALLALTLAMAALLCWAGHRTGNLYGGWSLTSFWDGGVRLAFSFPAGLLVYRMGLRLRNRLGFVGLSVLLVLALVMPYAHGAWIREVAIIIVGFPLLVTLGAGAMVTPKIERLCRFSGDLSYPLYMTHYAVVWIWGDYAEKHHFGPSRLLPAAVLGTCIMAAFAWAVFKFYDEPLRRYLRARL